jgi:hypothetical protein
MRRLLWASILLGLVVLLAAVSVLRVALWSRDEIERLAASVASRRGAFAS